MLQENIDVIPVDPINIKLCLYKRRKELKNTSYYNYHILIEGYNSATSNVSYLQVFSDFHTQLKPRFITWPIEQTTLMDN
jgi:hypothetical protein